ncbi:MAG: DedA family protein [Candidatus Dormibacteraeota bacterium]|nr:DedA family protein [Candidatus Dormibacteraeota bacterium]
MLSVLNGLHGTPGLLLLCGLLFAEEAGVPLPFAPGELVLLAAGLLIATGGLNVFIFVPAAIAVCVAGSVLGFGWARAAGPDGLHKIARKLHKEKALETVEERVKSAGPVGIGVTRLIPGLRIYTTLVAGALKVDRRRFIVALVPSTAIWVIFYVLIGAAVGIPAQRFFDRAAMLVAQAALLIVLAVGAFLAVRRLPANSESGIIAAPGPLRYALAIVTDLAVLASVVTGVWEIIRRVLPGGLGPEWLDAAAIVLLSVVLYVGVARRGPGATMGEALLRTTYLRGQRFRWGLEKPRRARRRAAGRKQA